MEVPCEHCLMSGDVPYCHALRCTLLCGCIEKLQILVTLHGVRPVQRATWVNRGRAIAASLIAAVAHSDWRLVDGLALDMAEAAQMLLWLERSSETDPRT